MHLWKFLWHTNVFPVATSEGQEGKATRLFSSLSVDQTSFFLHCNQKQSSNCADLWGNFKSRFWTLCNLGLFNGSLNIGKNYQIGVRLGFKKRFLPPSFVLVQFQSDWDIIWRVSGFFSSLYSHWLALWDKDSTTLRERKREFLLPLASDQIQVGTIPPEKKAQYSPATVIIDVICLSMFLLCFKFLLPKSACFIQCFIATRKLCRVGIL